MEKTIELLRTNVKRRETRVDVKPTAPPQQDDPFSILQLINQRKKEAVLTSPVQQVSENQLQNAFQPNPALSSFEWSELPPSRRHVLGSADAERAVCAVLFESIRASVASPVSDGVPAAVPGAVLVVSSAAAVVSINSVTVSSVDSVAVSSVDSIKVVSINSVAIATSSTHSLNTSTHSLQPPRLRPQRGRLVSPAALPQRPPLRRRGPRGGAEPRPLHQRAALRRPVVRPLRRALLQALLRATTALASCVESV